MKKSVMEAKCQLSDFSKNLYQVESTEDSSEALYLTAIPEQPISALHMKEWLEPSELPTKYAGISSSLKRR
jgi:seryl-tRNA synthetase